MLEKVKNLSLTPHGLVGEFLVRPFSYLAKPGFFKKFIIIFLIPFWGLFALLGIALNWLSLCEKNSEVNNFLDLVIQRLQESVVVDHSHFEYRCDEGLCWDEGEHKHFHIFSLTKGNFQVKHREIEEKIEELTKRGVLCNCFCKGSTANAIDFTLYHH